MTDVAFHVNVSDRMAYSCRLLRKAYLSGARVAVTAEPNAMIELDRMLWSFSPTDFVPHVLVMGESEHDMALSPILLIDALAACGHRDVLLNLGREVPDKFEDFERVIEVVADDQEALLAGRQRWRHYATRGFAPIKHDRAGSGAAS